MTKQTKTLKNNINECLLVIDFGSQVTQLIARRLRELSVYSKIYPFQNINQKLLDYDAPNFLCLEFEKIKSIYIPKLTIGEEKILLPALHLPELSSLSIVVGSSSEDWAAKFNNPHLLITAGDCGLTS